MSFTQVGLRELLIFDLDTLEWHVRERKLSIKPRLHTTLLCCERKMDVETTLCVSWERN